MSAEVKTALYSWESPFANCLSGAPWWRLPQSRDRALQGAPTADTAYMGLTSRRWITITGTIAYLRPLRNRHQAGCCVDRAAAR
jgi:hypothetical protein